MSSGLERVAKEVDRALRETGERWRPKIRVHEEGRVCSVHDGVARIEGLPSATFGELVDVAGHRALVMGLDTDHLDAALLDDPRGVRPGSFVRRGDGPPSLGVGPALFGRVVDPLGRPLDGLPLDGLLEPELLEREATPMHQRAAVHQPLFTGVLAIDAMFPIGRGQRELILGDEGTGKTALALDVLLRQARTDVLGIYVAIGRRRVETWRLVETLRSAGGRFVVVAASEDENPALRYLAPYAGAAVAEHFAARGEHALVVYDDLTAHAIAWRELSLLLGRTPGREAFPGDVFYLHSRLLERAMQLSPEHGGGSITALPLASLESGRLSAYIPTNLISITDGQIVLTRNLFVAGQKPAIDAGLSVSRVGGKAQAQALRALASRMRLDYAAFLELEVFARLGTRLEATAQARVEHGRRIRALLRAPNLAPLSVFGEVVRLVLANDAELLGRLDESSIDIELRRLEEALRTHSGALPESLERDGLLREEDRAHLVRALRDLTHTRTMPSENNLPSGVL